ncbi:MAG TPA: RNA-binding protein [Saprospiraceae bacterium]|nr:RNA-binding protein [Saprospiraceae bacterium]
MNLYVGNLSFQTREEDLKALFERYGEVTSVKIITDLATGKSKGFAFVEMANKEEAMAAIAELNNKEVGDRNIKVNEARKREDSGPRGGGGGGGFKRNPRY